MPKTITLPATPSALLDEYREATKAHLAALLQLDLLVRQRALKKLDAITRMMVRNDLPPSGLAWPWTRAEDFSRIDQEYSDYKIEVEDATRETKAAEYRVEAARLEMELILATLRRV